LFVLSGLSDTIEDLADFFSKTLQNPGVNIDLSPGCCIFEGFDMAAILRCENLGALEATYLNRLTWRC